MTVSIIICGKRKVFLNTDSPLWFYCALLQEHLRVKLYSRIESIPGHLWMISGTLSCAFHATKYFSFLNLFFITITFFYFTFQSQLPLSPFLPLSLSPPHPNSHSILRESEDSHGESIKAAPSPDAGPTPCSLYVGFARYLQELSKPLF